jgi:copper homeostasis protein
MKRVLLEVAIETPDDAYAATQGGADRLELCAALDLGGLTPSLGTLLEVRRFTDKPICVMIRPRPGDFVYSPAEFEIMQRDIEFFRPHKPAGFVFGILQKDGRVDLDSCLKLLKLADGVPCVFHRAFDRTPDLFESLKELSGMGFTRVLTSGQADSAVEGLKVLADLVSASENKIEILACGKIRADNVTRVIKFGKVLQVHGSFAEPLPERPERGYRGYTVRSITSLEAVRATRDLLDRPWELLIS